MSLGAAGIIAAAASHAGATGLFERVLTHEPKSAPGNGLTCAIWVASIRPTARGSGLAATSVRLVLSVRLYENMLADPQDAIDLRLLTATDTLMAAYTGDFTLGGAVRNVDLLGADGDPLSAQAGYINLDNRLLRVMDITLPVFVNDLWEQVA